MHFKLNNFPLFGLLILSSLQSAAGMYLIFYLAFAMIVETGMDKISIPDSGRAFYNFFQRKSKSFSSEDFAFDTLRKILQVVKLL